MDPNTRKLVKRGIIALLAVIAVLFLNPFVIVSAGQRGVVLNLGKVSRVMSEGLNMRVPVIQKVIKMDVRTQKEEVAATAASKDLQDVNTKVAVNYSLNPSQVGALWTEIGRDYKSRIIDPAIQESVKAVTAKFTAEEMVTHREEARESIKNLLREKLETRHIVIDELNIVNFEFSRAFNEAIEAKVTAEQNALAAKNKLEQVKFEAEQRITQAKGEAEAIRIQAQAITQQGGADYVQLQAIKAWDGKLPTQMFGSAVPFVNIK